MKFEYKLEVSYWKKDKYFHYGLGASSLLQAIRKIKELQIKANIEKLMYFSVNLSIYDEEISNW